MNFIKRNLTHKILPFFALFLFIFFIFITTNVKAVENSNVIEDFELQDYLNQNLMNGGWCLVMTKDTNDIYLITLSETAYNYLICTTSIDDSGIIYPSGVWTSMSVLGNYNRQANVVSYKFNKDTKKFGSRTSHSIGTFNPGACYLLKSGCDIYRMGSWTKFYTADGPLFTPPYIDNSEEELSNQNPSIIKILPASLEENIIHLEVCSYSIDGLDSKINVLQDISLDFASEFCVKETDEGGVIQNLHYEIPFSSLTAEFVSGDTYMFRLVYWDNTETKRTNSKFVTMKVSSSSGSGSEDDEKWSELGGQISQGFEGLNQGINQSTDKIVQEEQKTQQAINEQTKAIEENNKTNKNIFEKIGEMLSYINPFSENFFVYKLIELLIEMLKGLFIPSNEFFSSYFSDLNDWFSDRFGFLYYPLDLFFDLADRFLHINFSDPVIDIPNIYEPTTNTILIHATKYNFNSLLEQNSLKTAYDIYLIIVDAIIYVGLVILLYNKYEEVMTK